MKKSKIGIFFVLLYLIATIIFWVVSSTCSGMFCGLILVFPIMPWVFLLEGVIGDSIIIYLVLVVLNSLIFYTLGWLISLFIKKLKSSPKFK